MAVACAAMHVQVDTGMPFVLAREAGALTVRGTALIMEARDPHNETVIASTPSRLMIELNSW
ncbi:MAG: hypothetical protein NVS2B7_40210 [Herpetosiphon sp.]